ncbi:glycoside hydrolase family 10 protein [Algivirga pacifica]|uniref:Family 10 glycosylhydrolase n=1 Tax=Algivirga pacifica TaxID=1162670 RepID=A0ABP9D3G1_9BACT
MKHTIFLSLFFALLLSSCNVKESQPSSASHKENIPKKEPLRGVWVTNVDSKVLYSKEKIEEAVALCEELGINTIFMVTWNKAQTMYRSQVMKDFTGVEIDPELDPENTGRDPLQEMIEAAHQRGIKVYAWFEFGFSSSYNANGGILLEKKPHWASLNNEGKLVKKNGFEWMNALDPEVQDFMTSLVLEVVNKYEVDGIQGDDRLPAMPSQGGYNPGVIEAYKKEHFGQEPPQYYKDFEWVNWRAERLNNFMASLYQKVKKADPNCVVSMAPSVYPWSKEEYLQDWPTWLNHGYVDLLIPQVYRYDIDFYQQTLEACASYPIQAKKDKLYPGMLIKAGSKMPTEAFFEQMLQANRAAGFEGEVYFFYEGLHRYKEIIKKYYSEKNI